MVQLLARHIRSGQAASFLPGLAWARSHFKAELLQPRKPGLLARARMIYHLEGKNALFERVVKVIQHALR